MSYIEYTVRVYESGNRYWFLNSSYHREDGPAMEGANGDKCWFLNGKLHREDGPAVEYADGGNSWYLNDEYLTESEFNAEMSKRACDPSKSVVEIDGKKYKLSPIDS